MQRINEFSEIWYKHIDIHSWNNCYTTTNPNKSSQCCLTTHIESPSSEHLCEPQRERTISKVHYYWLLPMFAMPSFNGHCLSMLQILVTNETITSNFSSARWCISKLTTYLSCFFITAVPCDVSQLRYQLFVLDTGREYLGVSWCGDGMYGGDLARILTFLGLNICVFRSYGYGYAEIYLPLFRLYLLKDVCGMWTAIQPNISHSINKNLCRGC